MRSLFNSIKAFLKRTPLYPPVRSYFQNKRYQAWLASNRAGRPPHMAKQLVVKEYGANFGLRTLVETGTYLGDMIDAVQGEFDQIYTIELGDELFQRAERKFRNNPKVTTLHGDSGSRLQEVLAVLKTPALFWLDAHYTAGLGVSGRAAHDTPVLAELTLIQQHPLALQHVILIDDADEFTGNNDYPTLEQVKTLMESAGYSHVEVQDNIIRVHQ